MMIAMTVEPSFQLHFDGDCEAAFRFYERCLGGKITFLLRWGESPMAQEAPPEWSDKIVHATLVVGSTRLQGSDYAPGSYESPRGFVISLNVDESDAERLFAELGEGGTVQVPMQKTFWAPVFGMLKDRFGIPWAINGVSGR
jgi:PhnB protein